MGLMLTENGLIGLNLPYVPIAAPPITMGAGNGYLPPREQRCTAARPVAVHATTYPPVRCTWGEPISWRTGRKSWP